MRGQTGARAAFRLLPGGQSAPQPMYASIPQTQASAGPAVSPAAHHRKPILQHLTPSYNFTKDLELCMYFLLVAVSTVHTAGEHLHTADTAQSYVKPPDLLFSLGSLHTISSPSYTIPILITPPFSFLLSYLAVSLLVP